MSTQLQSENSDSPLPGATPYHGPPHPKSATCRGKQCIDKCPICGAGIECTQQVYRGDVTVDELGQVISHGEEQGIGSDYEVYCANDHSLDEMLDKGRGALTRFLDTFAPGVGQ